MYRMRSRNWPKNPGELKHGGAGFNRIFMAGQRSRVLSDKPDCKPLSGGTHDQLMEQRPTYKTCFAALHWKTATVLGCGLRAGWPCPKEEPGTGPGFWLLGCIVGLYGNDQLPQRFRDFRR